MTTPGGNEDIGTPSGSIVVHGILLPVRIFILALALVLPVFTSAHGGETIGRVEKDGYVVTLDAIVTSWRAGESERMNLEIERVAATTSAEVAYTDIWVRITGTDDAIHFVGTIGRAPDGFVTGLSFLFPESGNYEVTTRFMDGEREIVEASFPVAVAPSHRDWAEVLPWVIAPLLLVLGWIVGRTYRSDILPS